MIFNILKKKSETGQPSPDMEILRALLDVKNVNIDDIINNCIKNGY